MKIIICACLVILNSLSIISTRKMMASRLGISTVPSTEKRLKITEFNHNVKLTADEMHRLALWLDCNSDFYGTYENIEAQRRGEIVHHILE